MVHERLLWKCLDDINRMDIRLSEIDRKIDHIIFRLREMDPRVVAPTHCTGWRAIHALAAAFPDAFVPGSVGTRYVFESENGAA